MLLLDLTLVAALSVVEVTQGALPAPSPRAQATGERVTAASPAAVRKTPRRGTPSVRPAGPRSRIVAVARSHVGKPFAGDCSAFVLRVFRRANVPLPRYTSRTASTSEAIFRSLTKVREPRPGDVVVFHRTYDRERPGPGRNLFTHVGVVESVAGPRVTFIHRSGRGVQRSTMNLSRPGDPRANDTLRRRRVADRPAQRYLAGELFAGYASAVGGDLRAARALARDDRARSTEPPPARGEKRKPAPARPRTR
jgi:cell wall-associated NlpC family hydrolase